MISLRLNRFSILSLIVFLSTASSIADVKVDPYEATKKLFIEEINSIIEAIVNPRFHPEEFKAKFHRFGKMENRPEIIFLGNIHGEEKILLDQARMLQALLRPDDIILMEGQDAGVQGSCEAYILMDLFVARQLRGRGQTYTPEGSLILQDLFIELYEATSENLALGELVFPLVKCFFWDDMNARHIRPIGQSLALRNAAMVKEIKRNLNGKRQVFVSAGFLHLPSGERRIFERDHAPEMPAAGFGSLAEYYRELKSRKDQRAAQLRNDGGFGSTQVVYDFLADKNYSELIHKEWYERSSDDILHVPDEL